MTLCYAIKNDDINFFKHVIREICIMFQASIASKLKYVRAMLKQVYIIDTKAGNCQGDN